MLIKINRLIKLSIIFIYIFLCLLYCMYFDKFRRLWELVIIKFEASAVWIFVLVSEFKSCKFLIFHFVNISVRFIRKEQLDTEFPSFAGISLYSDWPGEKEDRSKGGGGEELTNQTFQETRRMICQTDWFSVRYLSVNVVGMLLNF